MNLEAINGKLKAAGYKVVIVERSGRLHLRATLPPPPGSSKIAPYQQRIALGLPVSNPALKIAEKRAREMGAMLLSGSFSWEKWRGDHPTQATVAHWLDRFEQDYWARRRKDGQTQTTWEIDYRGPFRRLDPYSPLTHDHLLQTLLTTTPDTRTRRRYCMAYAALAKFAGIAIDLTPYRGTYGPASTQIRDIPSDDQILSDVDKFSSPEWRWVFGILTCYGLRPHEVFLCRFDPFPRVRVTGGKSGRTSERLVYPLMPDWPTQLGIERRSLPACHGRNADLGHRVTVAFRRAGISYPPYNLRHAWALRAINRLDVAIASRMMGHSVTVHCKIYQRWLSESALESAWLSIDP